MIAWKEPTPAPKASGDDAEMLLRQLIEFRGEWGEMRRYRGSNGARTAKRRAIARAARMFPRLRFEFAVREKSLYGRCL